jgi:hypothetical protein
MADVKPFYPSIITPTITVAGLAHDASLLIGQQSTAITSDVLDYSVRGKIRTGTGPTTGRAIELWAVASWDGGTTWPNAFGASNAGRTISSAENKNQICRLVASIATVATSDQDYPFSCESLAAIFAGKLPKSWVLWLVHSTGVPLNATAGNHSIQIEPYYETVT